MGCDLGSLAGVEVEDQDVDLAQQVAALGGGRLKSGVVGP